MEVQTKVFKAFCDTKRLNIIELLQRGEMCACELLEELNMAQSTLSYHMNVLVESGVVDSRQEGKWTYYKMSQEGIDFAIEQLQSITINDMPRVHNNSCQVSYRKQDTSVKMERQK
ncbi:MAG TPA: winged helix-turn-helix transcriptional regulator [Erysipelothrix sp.]|nr:winged helix-turn-helix transcriptional regulator [Erysipelothrix sp.]